MSNRALSIAPLALLLALLPIAAPAQEAGGPSAEGASAYVIGSVDFSVKGKTIPFVMRQRIEEDGPIVGRRFPDAASLEAFIEEKRTVLANNRVFESVESSYSLGPEEGGAIPVAVLYSVVDTWNIMAIPMPDYSSDSGFKFYVKAKDYDFIGSMEPLTLNLSYVYDEKGDQSFATYASFKYPFKSLGLEWSLALTEDFEAWFDDWTVASNTGLSLTANLPGLGFPASVTVSQGFHYNEDQPTEYEPDWFYFSSGLSFNASIPTGLDLGDLGPISYGFSAGLDENWWPRGLDVGGREGLTLKHGDSLGSGRVDWVGNQRTGSSISASSSQTLNTMTNGVTWDLALTYKGFAAFWDGRAGIAAQVSGLARPNNRDNPLNAIADSLRGIRGGRVKGGAALVANLAVPVKLFDFPTHVLIKKDWLDFELQAQPFADLAIVIPDSISLKPSMDWIWAAGGLELLVYPKRFRSVIVRAGAGFDALNILKERAFTSDGIGLYELYFTTGLHF